MKHLQQIPGRFARRQRLVALLAALLPTTVVLIGLAAWLSTPVSGNATYEVALSEPSDLPDSTDFTRSLTTGDFNGDGLLDILSGSSTEPGSEARLKLWLNEGDGDFNVGTEITGTITNVRAVLAADMDGDGHLDIVAANRGQAITVWLNEGDGRFDAVGLSLLESAAETTSLATGDLDGDGALDIVAGIAGEANKVWLQTAAITTVTPITLAQSVSDTTAVALADIDGQAGLDIVAANNGDVNQLWLNDGSGGFGGAVALPGAADNTTAIAIADIDVDGRFDIVAGNIGEANRVWRQSAPLIFEPWQALPNSDSETTAVALAIADMDGDGFLDIVGGNFGFDQDHQIWINDGAGGFEVPAAVPVGKSFTRSLVAADLNNDGHIDLLAGNSGVSNEWWSNEGQGGFAAPTLLNNDGETTVVTLADVDNQHGLDIIVGVGQSDNFLYRNNGDDTFTAVPLPENAATDNRTQAMATADLDGENGIDIVGGNPGIANVVWFNDGSGNYAPPVALPTSGQATGTTVMAAGDFDGKDGLDLVAGNSIQSSQVWLNNGDGSFRTPFDLETSGDLTNTTAIATADIDGDGHLDIIAGRREGGSNTVWLNQVDGSFGLGIDLPDSDEDNTESIAVGDLDGDGFLDIVAGNDGEHSRFWLNDGQGGFAFPNTLPDGGDFTRQIALGDLDGNGTVDIVSANFGQSNHVWLNDGAATFVVMTTLPDSATDSTGVALGDIDGNGYVDIVTGSRLSENGIWYNSLRPQAGLPNHFPQVIVANPTTAGNADFVWSAEILSGRYLTVPYTLIDQENDPVGQISGYFSLDGGDNWQHAVPRVNSATTHLPASAAGTDYAFVWDMAASGVYGRSDNVVFRLQAAAQPRASAEDGDYLYVNSAGGFNQWATSSSTTFPFRLQGNQVQVMGPSMTGTVPAAQATVYRLPAGAIGQAVQLTDGARPYLPPSTNVQGYLPGRAPVDLGDQLVALQPVVGNGSITFTDKVRLFQTSAAVTNDGLEMTAVITQGKQILTTSVDNQLGLVDLVLSLEWDARNDPLYLTKLEQDLKRASGYLYDYSNGQMALGNVTVYQAKENWFYADVAVHASNQYRPNATIGGIVDEGRPETLLSTTVITDAYRPGQVHMGATWNRFGAAGVGESDDWAAALAHELGHYVFFLQDNYFGVTENGRFTTTDCFGSAMTNPYVDSYSEFLSSSGWVDDCLNTLANHTTGTPDWEMVRRHYPEFNENDGDIFAGPSTLPLALLTVDYVTPSASAAAADIVVDILDENNAALTDFSAQAQGYLFKTQGTSDLTDDTIVLLGSPTVGGLRVRGLNQGDRLCLLNFVPGAPQTGCADDITDQISSLTVAAVDNWEPDIDIHTVNTTTYQITVTLDVTSASALEGPLQLQMLPVAATDIGVAAFAPTGTLAFSGGNEYEMRYAAEITTGVPFYSGYARVWVPASGQDKESISEFRLSGDWPAPRASGGGFAPRASGGGFAPIFSGDGQALLLTTDPVALFSHEFRATLQTVSVLPDLPGWLTLVGGGYRFSLASGQTIDDFSSIVIQYLSANVPAAFESHLDIYYQPLGEAAWQQLPVERNTGEKLVSATVPNNEARGQGIYVLVMAVTAPALEPGWNEMIYPLPGSQPVDVALSSIAEGSTSVYGYDLDTFAWQLYDYTVLADHPEFAPLVNNLDLLEFGQSYWIYATETVTPVIPVRTTETLSEVQADGSFLPATFYGWVTPGEGFTPAVGDPVNAYIGERLCGSTHVTDGVGGDGDLAYVLQVAAGAQTGCGAVGSAITFVVDGRTLPLSANWSNSRACYLPLAPDDTAVTGCLPLRYTYLPIVGGP